MRFVVRILVQNTIRITAVQFAAEERKRSSLAYPLAEFNRQEYNAVILCRVNKNHRE